MYFKHNIIHACCNSMINIHTCADFKYLWSTSHVVCYYKFMYIFNYSAWNELVTSVVYADVGFGILIIQLYTMQYQPSYHLMTCILSHYSQYKIMKATATKNGAHMCTKYTEFCRL